MTSPSDRQKYKTAFGAALAKQLERRGMTQSEIAHDTNVSPGYVNHLLTGRKIASPEWVALIAETMALSNADRTELATAAATDNGWSELLNLTKRR